MRASHAAFDHDPENDPLRTRAASVVPWGRGAYTSSMNRVEIERRVREIVEARPRGIAAAYLFGSVAADRARAESDLDVAVLYSTDPPATLDGLGFDLAGEIELAIGRSVDIVVLNGAPVDLAHRVLRTGSLIIDPDRRARVAFEVRTRNEYWDLEPYLLEYRRQGTRRP